MGRDFMEIRVHRSGALPPDVDELVEESEAEAYRHVRRLVEEWRSGVARFDRLGEALYYVRCFNTSDLEVRPLAGIGGITIDPHCPDGETGRIRRLYVRPRHRGRGVGWTLLRSAMASRRGSPFRRIRVRTEHAGPYFERFGFNPIDDPNATHEWIVPPDRRERWLATLSRGEDRRWPPPRP